MKKAKSLLVAGALMLVTVGVVSAKSKFTSFSLWYDDGTGTKHAITNGFSTLSAIQNGGTGTGVTITGTLQKDLYISTDGGSTFNRAIASAF